MSLWQRFKAKLNPEPSPTPAADPVVAVVAPTELPAAPKSTEISASRLAPAVIEQELDRVRGTAEERAFLAAALNQRLAEPVALKVARALAERGEAERAVQLLETNRSPENLLLLAELVADSGDYARALATLERVLAHDLGAHGAWERHAHWSRLLGTHRLERTRRRAEVTVATAAPETATVTILREVARGGAGTVYEARDDVLQRRVAFKVFHRRADDADVLKTEVEMAGLLGPRCAVRVFDADPAQGWVTMEWVQLGSLRDWVSKCRNDAKSLGGEVWPWLVPLAQALAALHDHGFVHGDLKPGNILLRQLGEPVLTDFGLARREGETQAGGSAAYLSPERIAGAPTSFADDVYGFGRVIEEALSAHNLAEISGQWPQRVSAIATACLAKKNERIPSARKLVELLART